MTRNPTSGAERVAVTGFGLVTPLGLDAESTWSRLLMGASAIEGRLLDTNHRVAIAALEAEDLVGVDDRARVVSDRVTLLGVSAAAMAMESARLSVGSRDKDGNIDAECMSIMVGTSFGGIGSLIQEDRRTRDGKARVSPRLVTRAIPSALASHLAIQYRITGPVMTYLGACAASAQALGEAMVAILAGRSDRALVGGADSLFVDPLMLSLVAAGALATLGPEESAEGAVCPFGHGRRGMALGEGAAFFVLEREALARARGAAIHAFLVGYGAGNDAYHVTAPEPGGFGAERVMRMALRSANAVPTDIGYVSAHATGTMLGDAAEAAALRRVFADCAAVPVSSIKGALGHSLGAAGAIEAALSVLALRAQTAPPNTGAERPSADAPPGLLLEPRKIQPGALVLSNSFGFGGHNVSLIFAPGDPASGAVNSDCNASTNQSLD